MDFWEHFQSSLCTSEHVLPVRMLDNFWNLQKSFSYSTVYVFGIWIRRDLLPLFGYRSYLNYCWWKSHWWVYLKPGVVLLNLGSLNPKGSMEGLHGASWFQDHQTEHKLQSQTSMGLMPGPAKPQLCHLNKWPHLSELLNSRFQNTLSHRIKDHEGCSNRSHFKVLALWLT